MSKTHELAGRAYHKASGLENRVEVVEDILRITGISFIAMGFLVVIGSIEFDAIAQLFQLQYSPGFSWQQGIGVLFGSISVVIGTLYMKCEL